uniref:Outer capsid protein P8 n=1 Tax=Tobacco leaf enation phytoreovirus TaxID=288891 RepID=A2RQI5_9REOV|nr:unknown [Tobacco leaf enation phytoreovirus]
MSRQAWIETSALVESISSYIVDSFGESFSGLTISDVTTLANLMGQLSLGDVGFLNDLRTPLQTMSNQFIDFISTTDRCNFMLRPAWFDSDVIPAVTDNFIVDYVKTRFSNPISDTLRQMNNLSIFPKQALQVMSSQNAVMKALEPPYLSPVDPRRLARATAGANSGNYTRRRALATVLGGGAVPEDFVVAEKDKIIIGRRSLNPLPAAQYDINVPQYWQCLSVTNARISFVNSFIGSPITNVDVNVANGANVVANIRVPTDANDMAVDSDAIVSFSFSGGIVTVVTNVPLTGFAIAIEGDFHFQMNRCQSYYTGTSIVMANIPVDDFGLTGLLEPFRNRLMACGQSEIFSDAMNRLTMALLSNYCPDVQGIELIAFTSPWYRMSERFGTIVSFNQAGFNLERKRLIVRHLWIIMSFIAVFGRYYNTT